MLVVIILSVIVHLTFALGPEWSNERLLRLEKLVESQESRILELEANAIVKNTLIDTLNRKLSECIHTNTVICEPLPSGTKQEPDVDDRMGGSNVNELEDKPVGNRMVRDKVNVDQEPQKVPRLLVSNNAPNFNAFFAYMSKNENNLGPHHTLIFDELKTTIGSGYNRYAGIFTTPVDGVFVFSVTIRMRISYAAYNIVKNAEIVTDLFVDAHDSGEQSSTSATVVMELEKDDIVFVRTSPTYNPHGKINSDTNGRTSFAGWQIQ